MSRKKQSRYNPIRELTRDLLMEPNSKYLPMTMGKNDQRVDAQVDRPAIHINIKGKALKSVINVIKLYFQEMLRPLQNKSIKKITNASQKQPLNVLQSTKRSVSNTCIKYAHPDLVNDGKASLLENSDIRWCTMPLT